MNLGRGKQPFAPTGGVEFLIYACVQQRPNRGVGWARSALPSCPKLRKDGHRLVFYAYFTFI